MTYTELLRKTATRKKRALRDISKALSGPAGDLAASELQRAPGSVAWFYLAEGFCRALADHFDELMEQASELQAHEICDICMAYHDRDPGLYNLLPVEAQLFTA